MTSLCVVPDIVRRGAKLYGDRIAIETESGICAMTYGALLDAVRRGAAALRARGLRRGDRVLLVMDGSTDWPPAFFSAMWADLVVVPIPARLPAATIAIVAAHADARVAIGDLASTPYLTFLTPADLTSGQPQVEEPSATADDLAVLVFTSGSTARPRAVGLSHGNLVANLRSLMQVREAATNEAFLSVLPPAHAYELVAGQLAPFAAGARVVYSSVPLPNRIIRALRDRSITRVTLVPALLEALCRDVIESLIAEGIADEHCRELSPVDLSACVLRMDGRRREALRTSVRQLTGPSLRIAAVGGAALAPAWSTLLETFDVGIDLGYGLTEAGPLVSVGLATENPRQSVGRPLPDVHVRISAAGEILVRSAGVMRGYWKDPQASAATLDGEWLHTGDRGHLDARGCLFITGRLKDAIVTASGETLYPDEIEPYYASMAFLEHCVVPARGPDGNDVPTLVVVSASPETTDAEIQRIFADLRAAAPARFRVSRLMRRPMRLPRTTLGKLQRRALAEELKVS